MDKILNPQSIDDVVTLENFKGHCVTKALSEARGSKVKAGLQLGISQKTLFTYIKKYKIKWVERWIKEKRVVNELRDCFEYQFVNGKVELIVGEKLDNRTKRFYKGK